MLSRVESQNLNRLSVNSFILEIDTTEVLVYEFEAVQTYTFKIITSRTTSTDFTNLVVTKNKNGLKETIIEYFPNAPWLTHPTEAFNGTSHIIDDVGNVLEIFSTLFNAGSATNLDDISNTINFDLLSNTIYYRKADALGKSYNNNIAPSVNLDHHDKRVIANSCLEFYISPKLDSIAFSEYQKFKEHNKQKYE